MTQEKPLTYTDVMFDLETMGTDPDAPILSIAAVGFNVDSGIIMNKSVCFNQHISLEDSLRSNFKPSGNTILWWLNQSEEARQKLLAGQRHINVTHPVTAMQYLQRWMENHTDIARVRVWGNGASFDPVLLEHHFRMGGMDIPWEFWNIRCFRTVKNLLPSACIFKPAVAHDALEDAYAQAQNCVSVLQALSAKTGGI